MNTPRAEMDGMAKALVDVMALADKATPGPFVAADETQDIGRGMIMHFSVVKGGDGENIVRLGYTDQTAHLFAAASNFIGTYGPDLSALISDAERYRYLREDVAESAVPRVFSSDESASPLSCLHGAELDAAIDAARAGGGHE